MSECALRQLHADNKYDVAVLQSSLEAAPIYSLIVEGRLPSTSAAKEMFEALPQDKNAADKFAFEVRSQVGPTGCVDFIRDYPEEHVAYWAHSDDRVGTGPGIWSTNTWPAPIASRDLGLPGDTHCRNRYECPCAGILASGRICRTPTQRVGWLCRHGDHHGAQTSAPMNRRLAAFEKDCRPGGPTTIVLRRTRSATRGRSTSGPRSLTIDRFLVRRVHRAENLPIFSG
jgi:hypothetical protein